MALRKKKKDWDTETMRAFNMRMSKENWLFMKQLSAIKGLSMSQIIIDFIEDYKKSLELRKAIVKNSSLVSLTSDDTIV